MDARFRKLYPRIWQHPSFQSLSIESRLIALYVLTGPQSNRIGYYRLSAGEASEDLGISPSAFSRGLASVCQCLDWAWDECSRVVWIKSWWTWNPPGAPNNLIGSLKDYAEVPPSVLSIGFAESCSPICEEMRVPVPNPSRTGAEPVANGLGYPSPTQEKDQETQTQQETKTDSAGDGFKDFWTAYPRKVAKPAAIKAWAKLKPDPDLQRKILAAIVEQRRSDAWTKDNGAFVPHPATWLNGRRWEDELIVDTSRLPLPPAQESWVARCKHDPKCPSQNWHDLLTEREAEAFLSRTGQV